MFNFILINFFNLLKINYSSIPHSSTSPPSSSPITIKIKNEPSSPPRDLHNIHQQNHSQTQHTHLSAPQLAHLANSRPSSNGSQCSNQSSNGQQNNNTINSTHNNHLSPGQPLTPSTSSSPDPHCTADFESPLHKRIRAEKTAWTQM